MKKLLLFGAIAFGLNAFGQDATYSFDISPGYVSLRITQSGSDYTVVNLDEFCQGFRSNFLLNEQYSHSTWSTDEHNVIEFSEQEGLLGITAYISKKTKKLEKINFFDDTGAEGCWMGGEYFAK